MHGPAEGALQGEFELAMQIAFSDCLSHVLQIALDSPGSNTLHPILCMTCQPCEAQKSKAVSNLVLKHRYNTTDALLSIVTTSKIADSKQHVGRQACV